MYPPDVKAFLPFFLPSLPLSFLPPPYIVSFLPPVCCLHHGPSSLSPPPSPPLPMPQKG